MDLYLKDIADEGIDPLFNKLVFLLKIQFELRRNDLAGKLRPGQEEELTFQYEPAPGQVEWYASHP